MRNITHIVIHCTATLQTATTESIKRYWKEIKRWKSPGYHYLVEPDGTVVQLAQLWEITNGVGGHNSNIINLAYVGGVAPSTGSGSGKPQDNRTEAQKQSLLYLVRELKKKFPTAIVQGHRDFPAVEKACPSFDAKKEYGKV